MGAALEWTNRIGLNRHTPGWIRCKAMPVVNFLVITILAQTVDAPAGVHLEADIHVGANNKQGFQPEA